jgi:hypothetical protein
MKHEEVRAVAERAVKTIIGVILCISAICGAAIETRLPKKLPIPNTVTANLLGKRSKVAM